MPDIQLITAGNASLETRFGVFLKPNKSWNIRASPVVVSFRIRSYSAFDRVLTPYCQDRSRNKIRNTLNSITSCPPLTAKSPINLGLGDPTFYPLHPPPSAAVTAVKAVLEEETSNGYLPGVGSIEARQAVADYHERWDGVKYGVDDIVLVSQRSSTGSDQLTLPDSRCRPRS